MIRREEESMLEKQEIRRNRSARPASEAPGRETQSSKPAGRTRGRKALPGLRVDRFFTQAGDDGYDGVSWELRTASISGESGKMVFEQRDVEVPRFWSQTATNVVVQKYFRGQLGTETRERSVRQLIDRVADTITGWGIKDGYFVD